jgi:hypothetical protein
MNNQGRTCVCILDGQWTNLQKQRHSATGVPNFDCSLRGM